MTAKVRDIVKILNDMAPPALAEEWDNVGLLVGRQDAPVKRLMVALDFSESVLEQAIRDKADMVVTHHPVIFKGVRQLTDGHWHTRLLLDAAANHIAVYSAHTNLDSAAGGVNDVLARILGLEHVEGLNGEHGNLAGIGRIGSLPVPMALAEFAGNVKKILKLERMAYVDGGRTVRRVAVCGGSGMDFLDAVREAGADTFVTGDVKYHEAQEAAGLGINLIDAGHQGTELPVVNSLADRLALRLTKEDYAVDIRIASEAPVIRFL